MLAAWGDPDKEAGTPNAFSKMLEQKPKGVRMQKSTHRSRSTLRRRLPIIAAALSALAALAATPVRAEYPDKIIKMQVAADAEKAGKS